MELHMQVMEELQLKTMMMIFGLVLNKNMFYGISRQIDLLDGQDQDISQVHKVHFTALLVLEMPLEEKL